MMAAGIGKLAGDGMNRAKDVQNSTPPSCHTIGVVMSLNGLYAPPALAPTAISKHDRVTKRRLSPPTASTSAHIGSAVVMLPATGKLQKDRKPASQNGARNPKRLLTSQPRYVSHTFRFVIVLMQVIATSRNSIPSA